MASPAAFGNDLRRLRLVWRPLLILMAPWLVIVALLAMLGYDRLLQDRIEPLRLAQSTLVSQGNTILSGGVSNLRRDVLLLSRSPALAPAIESGQTSRLVTVFRLFSETSGIYDQIRWIDANGMERVRVDFDGRSAHTVPVSELQDKSDRPYFTQGMKLSVGQVAFSRMDLNVEHGQIEQPHKPVLRISTPLFDNHGARAGILILNVLAKPLLDDIGSIPNRYGFGIHVVDSEGYWLLSPREDDRWGFMLGHPERTLARRNPALWNAMLVQDSGTLQNSSGLWTFGVFSFRQIDLRKAGPADSDDNLIIARPVLRIAVHLPAPVLRHMELQALAITLVTALLALVAAFWLATRLALSAHDRNQAIAALERGSRELHHANSALSEALQRQQAMQDELVQAEKLSALGMMVAGVAHELNTPIGAAVVSTTTLQKQLDALRQEIDQGLRRSALTQFLRDQEEGTQLIAGNLARAATLVRTFRQLAIDRAVMERRLFGLGEVVEAVQRTLKPMLQQAPQPLIVDIPENIVLDSYPGPLGQVLENLVSNAYRHAFPNGRAGTVRLEAGHDDGTGLLTLRVRDDGCGIPPELLPRVFDPFTTTSRNRGGMGLGLHLAHQLASEMLGGRLTVESRLGHGSCFTLRIPLVVPQAGRPGAAESQLRA